MHFAWIVDDNNVTLALLCGVIFLIIPYLYLTSRSGRCYPPGPLALPIIGNVHQIILCGSMDIFCEKYRKIYGNLFTVETGGAKHIVVSGYDNFKRLLITHADLTSVRGTQSRSDKTRRRSKVAPGLIFAPYPNWKSLRTVSLHSLRDDGMGRAALEPQIAEEIEQYINFFIEPNHGKPIDLTCSLPQATANIISQLMFNQRFEFGDEKFNKLISVINESVKLVQKLGLTANIPFNKYIFKSWQELSRQLNGFIATTFAEIITKKRIGFDGENPQGVIEHYIQHSKSEKGKDDFCFADANAEVFTNHVFIGGTETTATALKFCLLYMCKYPEVQEKVWKEIESQIGSRQVTYKDRLAMPFTEAVLLETLRIGNVVPNALPHTAEGDITIDGKVIPQGTDLVLNMASVLHDEAVFEDPLTFKPQRYLEGDIALKKQRTIPFSIGRRNCLGESLAKVEFFMFFVSFMQRYSVKLPLGSEADPSDTTPDVIRCPKPYEIIFSPRVQ